MQEYVLLNLYLNIYCNNLYMFAETFKTEHFQNRAY